jgi:hypothetical protein
MSSTARTGNGDDDSAVGIGSSTEQHITGLPETGTFSADQAPTGDTPVHGSSNAGQNSAAERHDATKDGTA